MGGGSDGVRERGREAERLTSKTERERARERERITLRDNTNRVKRGGGGNLSQGRVCPSIDLVCCGNIGKETHKLLDPEKLSVVNLLNFSRVNTQTQICVRSSEFS